MSEMVDKVAVAISGAPFPSASSRRKARAAIKAMMKPAEETIHKCAIMSGHRHDHVEKIVRDFLTVVLEGEQS